MKVLNPALQPTDTPWNSSRISGLEGNSQRTLASGQAPLKGSQLLQGQGGEGPGGNLWGSRVNLCPAEGSQWARDKGILILESWVQTHSLLFSVCVSGSVYVHGMWWLNRMWHQEIINIDTNYRSASVISNVERGNEIWLSCEKVILITVISMSPLPLCLITMQRNHKHVYH